MNGNTVALSAKPFQRKLREGALIIGATWWLPLQSSGHVLYPLSHLAAWHLACPWKIGRMCTIHWATWTIVETVEACALSIWPLVSIWHLGYHCKGWGMCSLSIEPPVSIWHLGYHWRGYYWKRWSIVLWRLSYHWKIWDMCVIYHATRQYLAP